MRARVQRAFWRSLEAVGVKNARRRWEGQSPFLQRAVPPLVIAALVRPGRLGAGSAAAPDAARAAGDRVRPLSAATADPEDRAAADGPGGRDRLPGPVGERAQRHEHPVRDPDLQGVPEHGHDGRDRDLRDDGHRAEHGRRLRGSARSRVRRVLCDRRLHGGLVRLPALLVDRLRARRDRRAGRT